MTKFHTFALIAAGAASTVAGAFASDMTIHLKGSPSVTKKVATYHCDGEGTALGLPAGPFAVEYLNGGANSLAVVPINGQSLIFAGVVSASGARYASGRFIWWDAGSRGTTLTRDPDSSAEMKQANCQVKAARN